MATAEYEVMDQEAESPPDREDGADERPGVSTVDEHQQLLDDILTAIEKAGGQSKRAREIMRFCERIARTLELDRSFEETLEEWPTDDDENPVSFADARQPALIADLLVRGLHEFEHLRGRPIEYLYREKDFTVGGKIAQGKCQKPGGLLRRFSGADFILVFSHKTWLRLNVWQRVALVYHELRHAGIDEEKDRPYIVPHQWEGFFDEVEIFGIETFRTWQRLSEATGRARHAHPALAQRDLFEGTDELDDEEGRAIRAETARAVRLEQRRALVVALPHTEAADGLVIPIDAAEMDDQAIATWLLDFWEEVEYDDGERTWPGIFRVLPPDLVGAVTRTVWCAVATNNGVPRFWYDVDPEQFDRATLAATFQGEPLFREVRRAWGVLPEEPAPEVRVETETEPPEDPFAAWKRRTLPAAEMDSNTSILLHGIHELLLDHENLAGRLYAAHQEGMTEDALAELLSNSLENGQTRSVAVNIVGDGNLEYVAIEAKVDPLTFTMKRGRKKEALKGEGLLSAIRTMLEIPEPLPAEEPADDETPVAVGADDEDDTLPF